MLADRPMLRDMMVPFIITKKICMSMTGWHYIIGCRSISDMTYAGPIGAEIARVGKKYEQRCRKKP